MQVFFKPTVKKILFTFLLAAAIIILSMSIFGGYLLNNLKRLLLSLVMAYILVCFFGKKTVWFLGIIWVITIIAFLYVAFTVPPIY